MKEWPQVRFGKFLTPNRRPYKLGPTEDANLVGVRWYGLGPFHRELKSAVKIRKKSHYVIRSGDVIYNKLFAWKGAFGIVREELDGMFVSDKFPTYELDENVATRRYLAWYFRCPSLWEEAHRLSTGSAAISKLTLNPPKFDELTIPLPPLSEQRRIAAKIEHLAAKIEEAQGLRSFSLGETEVLLKARLKEITDEFDELNTLGGILTEKPRNGWSARCDNTEGGTPVLTLGAVTGFYYDSTAHKRTSLPTDLEAHYWLGTGDLLISRSNTPDLVGHAAIYDGKPKPCIYPDLMMRLTLDAEVADKRFVWFWLQSPLVRDFIKNNAKGTSPTMKKISQRTVQNIPFPAGISLGEQRRIVKYLDGFQARIDRLKTLQTKATKEFDALLPSILDKAFKGEL